MKALMTPINTGVTQYQLTMTMSLDEWKKLNEQLITAWPSWKLSEAIGRLVRHAETHWAEEVDLFV